MVSPRKSLSALGQIPEEEDKMNPKATKSCESLYSNSSKGSANMIYRRKPAVSNKMGGVRQSNIIPATNEVRQRVLSARRLRMKTYQNQLADAQQTIAELAHENRMLRTLHKRQDSALAKYESTNAELPQLLHSHAEELRVWQTKYRNLQATNKDLEHKLKQKEAVILSLSDQNKYYIQLNKDKNLEDRQRLTEKLQNLEARLHEKDNDIKMMARKMQLELKQSKQQLQMEQKKNKEILLKLEKARLELSGYRKLEEMQLQEKFNMNVKRNKGNNNTDTLKDPYANTTDSETAVDDIDASNSHRSTHSTQNLSQRTTRSHKNMSNKKNMTLVTTSTTVAHVSKLQTPHKKPITSIRFDQGDGDASSANFLMQKQRSTLSSKMLNQSENLQNDYEDENECDYEAESNNQVQDHELDDKIKEIQCDDSGNNEHFLRNLDEANNLFDSEKNIEDFYAETQTLEVSSTGKKTRMKEEISSIRKQISDDYKEREAFLDTFCRQATNGVLRDEKKHNITVTDHRVPNNRKHKLLAALKEIDDNKSQD